MKRMKKIVGVDRISELPEFIIHQIMSNLPTKDAFKTSVLSKKWYAFKASYPVLDFNQKRYDKEPVSKFRDSVNNSLRHFNRNKLGLQAFSVHICSPVAWCELDGQTKSAGCSYLLDQGKKKVFSDLDSWLSLALENGVKNLDLDAGTRFYTLPQPYSFSKILTILNLNRCHLEQPLSLFSSLMKLGLKNCHVDCPIILKEGDCPLLQDFVFYDCYGFKAVVYISDLPQLHTVEVSVGRYAPIDELVVSCHGIQNFTIRDVLAPLSVVNIVGCDHLKILQLMSANVTDTQFHHLLSKLPLLEELYVFHCYSLQAIKISNPRLKTLVVSLVCQDSLKIIEIAAPSLKSFIFASDLFKRNCCRIKVPYGCSSLETLVLFKYFAAERTIQNLISKFPLVKNLWIIGFPELQRIRIPNPQLMRLHFVRCLKLKAVNVESPNLCEFCYTGPAPPKVSVADMEASGGLSFEEEASRLWLDTFKAMLTNIGIKDYLLTRLIVSFVHQPL